MMLPLFHSLTKRYSQWPCKKIPLLTLSNYQGKIVFSLVDVKFYDFFQLSTVATTRGHPFKPFKEYTDVNARKSFLLDVLLICGTTCHQILLILVRYAHLNGQLK